MKAKPSPKKKWLTLATSLLACLILLYVIFYRTNWLLPIGLIGAVVLMALVVMVLIRLLGQLLVGCIVGIGFGLAWFFGLIFRLFKKKH